MQGFVIKKMLQKLSWIENNIFYMLHLQKKVL